MCTACSCIFEFENVEFNLWLYLYINESMHLFFLKKIFEESPQLVFRHHLEQF